MADDQIQVQITADTSNFEAAMQNAANAAQTSFDKIKAAAEAAGDTVDKAGKKGKSAGQTGKKGIDDWAKSFSNLQGTINSSINGMILGTMTWQKAVQRLTQTALSDFLKATEKGLVTWLTTEKAKTDGTAAGAAARTETESAGQAEGLG